MADLGFLKPPTIAGRAATRWVWPFRQMDVGDFFRVAAEDKSIHDVRNIASVRAYQLGIRLSVKTDERGDAVVTRVPSKDVQPIQVLAYDTACKRVTEFYGNLDTFSTVPWEGMAVGQKYFAATPQRTQPPYPYMLIRLHHDLTYHLELGARGFGVTRLADGTTAEGFAATLDLMK